MQRKCRTTDIENRKGDKTYRKPNQHDRKKDRNTDKQRGIQGHENTERMKRKNRTKAIQKHITNT